MSQLTPKTWEPVPDSSGAKSLCSDLLYCCSFYFGNQFDDGEEEKTPEIFNSLLRI
jgi:hypothetical protein